MPSRPTHQHPHANDISARTRCDVHRHLGSEELDSVYEALLELHPRLNLDAATFALAEAAGSERKTTGSYYTPTSLTTRLLDSALDPVVDEALQGPDPEQALLASMPNSPLRTASGSRANGSPASWSNSVWKASPDEEDAGPRVPERRHRWHPISSVEEFMAAVPHELWVADITYVPTWKSWLFLAVVVDACSRRVCGWPMRDDLKADLVVGALGMATTRRQPGPGLIHHSDRGGQYRSLAFGRTLRDSGIVASMGPRRDAYDNAARKSFMASIKIELVKRNTFKTRNEARLAVFS